MNETKFLIPEFDGEYKQIYSPSGEVYNGPDTSSFKTGEFYEEWITNDFSVLNDGDKWHIVGITHPRPKGFISDCEYYGDVHEAEYQLFHCSAVGETFESVFKENSFQDNKKILYPSQRPNERPEIWAPHLMKKNGVYNIIYSPKQMRRATSVDFNNWKIEQSLFECNHIAARDPYIYEEDGTYYMIYTEEKVIKYRTSSDLTDWSDENVLQECLFKDSENESPFLLKKDDVYYLFWSIYNGKNGCYDSRTMVFAANRISEFKNCAPITMLKAHAPEIVCDKDGTYYLLSVFYPQNGISAVKLKWV